MHKSTLEILKSINRFLFTKIQVVNNDFVDTSRTCDADSLTPSALLGTLNTGFPLISSLVSIIALKPAQALFHQRFHRFREDFND